MMKGDGVEARERIAGVCCSVFIPRRLFGAGALVGIVGLSCTSVVLTLIFDGFRVGADPLGVEVE